VVLVRFLKSLYVHHQRQDLHQLEILFGGITTEIVPMNQIMMKLVCLVFWLLQHTVVKQKQLVVLTQIQLATILLEIYLQNAMMSPFLLGKKTPRINL